MKLTDALDKIRAKGFNLRAERNQKLGDKELNRYSATKKNIYAQRALDRYNKAEADRYRADPHVPLKTANAYIRDKQDKEQDSMIDDYLKHNQHRQFFENNGRRQPIKDALAVRREERRRKDEKEFEALKDRLNNN